MFRFNSQFHWLKKLFFSHWFLLACFVKLIILLSWLAIHPCNSSSVVSGTAMLHRSFINQLRLNHNGLNLWFNLFFFWICLNIKTLVWLVCSIRPLTIRWFLLIRNWTLFFTCLNIGLRSLLWLRCIFVVSVIFVVFNQNDFEHVIKEFVFFS